MEQQNIADRLAATQIVLVLAFIIALAGALKPADSDLMARVSKLEKQMKTVPEAAVLLVDAMPRGHVDLDPESPINKRLIEYLKPRKLTDPCIVSLAAHVAKTRRVALEQNRGANAEELNMAYDLFKECLR